MLLAELGMYELKPFPDGKYELQVLEFFCCSVSPFFGVAAPFAPDDRRLGNDGTYELQVLFCGVASLDSSPSFAPSPFCNRFWVAFSASSWLGRSPSFFFFGAAFFGVAFSSPFGSGFFSSFCSSFFPSGFPSSFSSGTSPFFPSGFGRAKAQVSY